MPSDIAVRAHDHRHRVPADEALDPALDLLAAGKRRFLFGPHGVDVRRDGRERQRHARRAGAMPQRRKQSLDAAAIALLDDVVERLEPFPLFDRLDFRGVTRRDVFHGSPSLLSQNFGITILLLYRGDRGTDFETPPRLSRGHIRKQPCDMRLSAMHHYALSIRGFSLARHLGRSRRGLLWRRTREARFAALRTCSGPLLNCAR